MEEAIRNFPKQFSYKPIVENEHNLAKKDIFVVAGMGGSHLQADILQAVDPAMDIVVHSDYGLDSFSANVLETSLVIASSYSGNTEEALDVFQKAIEKKYAVAAIATGGKLLELAKAHSIPYVQLPDTGIQPRSALGFAFKALAVMVGRNDIVAEATKLELYLQEHSMQYESQGSDIAQHMRGRVPVIYASRRNYAIAYNWKIKCNETGKIPAFYNVFPELNHNEMNGFDITDSTRSLCEPFSFVFLRDAQDHPRIQKRMEVLEAQLHARSLSVEIVELEGESRLERIFSSLLVADWVALETAKLYSRDPESVPMIEEFKKSLQ